MIRLLSYTSLLTLLTVFVFYSCQSPENEQNLIDTTITTKNGTIKGSKADSSNVMTFKGIPYAAPPIGNLRWKAPQPVENWDGVKDASTFGPSAIQVIQGSRLPWTEEFMVQNEISEDCLYLNIWTPASSPEDNLPVLFFIHGGALREGSGAVDVYDGEELAKKGIIVVTINYRLGALGFLAHPELSEESPNNVSGNYGLLDQFAALSWVKENIAAFGGDSSQITIAGQSAGAGSVNALTIMPQANGFFQGAITESGTRLYNDNGSMMTLQEGEQQGLDYMKSKNVNSLEELRALSSEELLSNSGTEFRGRFGRVVDGFYQPDNFKEIFEAGNQNDTPYMNGYNADETQFSGETSNDTFSQLYPYTDEMEEAAAKKLAGQQQTLLNAHYWLEHRAKTTKTDAYAYFFTQAIPWPEHPEFGAFHTGEIPYVFNNLKMIDRPWTEEDSLIADQMSSYWVNFVKNGNPNGEGLTQWNPYKEGQLEVMILGENPGMAPITENAKQKIFLTDQLTTPSN